MLMQMASHHRGSTGVRLKMADASEFVGRNSDNCEKAVQAPLVALFRTLKAIIADHSHGKPMAPMQKTLGVSAANSELGASALAPDKSRR